MLIIFLKPSPHSPKANARQVTTIMMMEAANKKGPLMASFNVFMVELNGKLPAVLAKAVERLMVLINTTVKKTNNFLSQFFKYKFLIFIFFQSHNFMNKSFLVSLTNHRNHRIN